LQLPSANIDSDQKLVTGYHHETVIGLAPEIISAVQEGKIQRFFVIAGCDAPGRGGNYYRELATLLPNDTVILTTSCGKFRFNDIDFGTVGNTGIPRYIDLGQCNNSISTVKIARALADAFQCEINELPVSIVLSWFEQKAIAILLGLFSLGITDIRIGPKAPEFLTPGVLNFLQKTFNLKLIGDPQEDLSEMLAI
jgi:hydroxylamine reductase